MPTLSSPINYARCNSCSEFITTPDGRVAAFFSLGDLYDYLRRSPRVYWNPKLDHCTCAACHATTKETSPGEIPPYTRL